MKIILNTLFEKKEEKFTHYRLYQIIKGKAIKGQQTGLVYKENTSDAIKLLNMADLFQKLKRVDKDK